MSILVDPVTGEKFVYYTRAEWGARAPKWRNPIANTSGGTFGHHSVTDASPSMPIVRGIQAYHMDKQGWADIAYSFLYDNDGAIFEGRGWGIAGGHTQGYNSTSHAFCFIGNTDVMLMSEKAKRAFVALWRVSESLYGKQQRRAHGDVNSTACPGKNKRDWIHAGCPTGSVVPPPQPPPVQPPVTPPPSAPMYKWRYYRKPTVLSVALRKFKRNDVAEVQFCTNLLSERAKWIAVDGYYGTATATAIKNFQAAYNAFWKPARPLVVDGKFGPASADAMAFVLGLKGY